MNRNHNRNMGRRFGPRDFRIAVKDRVTNLRMLAILSAVIRQSEAA